MPWPAIAHEELPWLRDPDELALIPKSRRRAIAPTYRAAVPAAIADAVSEIPQQLKSRIDGLMVDLARADARPEARGYDLPALLLRSESAASSQIENLTSSVRNVALAELSGEGPHNALLIAGNIAAMREALSLPDEMSVQGVLNVHRALMGATGASFAGRLRDEQVWVGGTAYSPHGALYVAPQAARIADCLEDVVAFSRREDVNPVVKAAIVHAQFETIHPFIDGNGRTGRALLHKVLQSDGILTKVTLPISAGLLHAVDSYMGSIVSFRRVTRFLLSKTWSMRLRWRARLALWQTAALRVCSGNGRKESPNVRGQQSTACRPCLWNSRSSMSLISHSAWKSRRARRSTWSSGHAATAS